MKKTLSLLLVLALVLLSGCTEEGPGASSTVGGQTSGTVNGSAASDVDFSQLDSEMFTDRDQRHSHDESGAVTITLQGSTATASSNAVEINGATVRITQEGTYLISGTLDDGMLMVDAPDTAKLQLVFNGVSITGSDCAALYIRQADKVFLTLAAGTENGLYNGGSFTAIDENNMDGTLFSKQDLTINGTGSLTVDSPGGHGIVCKDDLVITGGTLRVDAAGHALDANDSVRFTGASLTVTAGKDGIHCENTEDTEKGFVYLSGGSLNLQAEGDGIDASGYVHIVGGSLDILAGGGSVNGDKASSDNWGGHMGGPGGRPGGPGSNSSGSSSSSTEDSTSMKGIKSGSSMQLEAGSFQIDSADDALHSNASLTVNGGSYTIATGDDALHAEDTLTVNGGTISISESYEGLEALHILVAGGDIDLVASDDGLNAAGGTDASGTGGRDDMHGGPGGGFGGNSNGSIVISGGTLYINASGDGIDANGTLEITGGHTTVVGPTQGDTATLDYDKSATITGGTFIGTGASGMAQTFSDSAQGVFAVSVGSQAAGTQITLTDSDGNVLVSYAPALSFQVVILSTPELVSGESYTITVGSQSGTFEAY